MAEVGEVGYELVAAGDELTAAGGAAPLAVAFEALAVLAVGGAGEASGDDTAGDGVAAETSDRFDAGDGGGVGTILE